MTMGSDKVIRTYDKIENAARAYARRNGKAKGASGGWIYNVRSDGTLGARICQGWATYGYHLAARGLIMRHANPPGSSRAHHFTLNE